MSAATPRPLLYRELCPRPEAIHCMRFHWKPRKELRYWHNDHGSASLVEEGGLWLVDAGGRRRRLARGDLSVIGPDHVFSYERDGDDGCAMLRILVPAERLAAITGRLAIPAGQDIWRRPPVDAVLTPHAAEVQSLRLRGEAMRANPPDELDAEAFVLDILRLGRAQGMSSAFAGLPDWLRAALVRMNSHEYLPGGPAALAILAGRHLDHVNRVLRAATGKTATGIVNGLRLEYAANRLRLLQVPVADIARDAGFSNVAHFYRLFRASYGSTPAAYRRGGHPPTSRPG